MQVTTLTDEQTALRDVTRDVLATESNPAAVRQLTESGTPFSEKLWTMAGELGWLGMEAPESAGGSGQTFYETSLVLRELGRATTPGPFLSQALVVAALNAVPDHPVAAAWLERLCSGEAKGAVAVGVLDLRGHLELPISAVTSGAGIRLDGRQADVPDIGLADLVLVAAKAEDGPVVVAVPAPTEALAPEWQPTHDRTRRLYDIALDGVEVPATNVVAIGDQARSLIDLMWHRACTGIALDGVGGAAKVLEMTVGYTAQRVQYGRVIATFQAVKHTCADMFVESEVARIASDAAVLEIVAGSEAQRYWSSVAKFRAADAYAQAAGDALQMHGGIGMTWEFDLHYWLKRAKLNVALYGHSDVHRARVSQLV